MDDTKSLVDCRTTPPDIVGLAKKYSASPWGDMHSSAGFTDLDGKQNSNLGLKLNDAKVNKFPSLPELSCLRSENRVMGSSPQSRGLPE